MAWVEIGDAAKAEVLAVHAALLRRTVRGQPRPQILYFGGDEFSPAQAPPAAPPQAYDHTRLYDCQSAQITQVPSPGQAAPPATDLFCCGHALDAHGRLVTGGGTGGYPTDAPADPHEHHWLGVRSTWLFDPTGPAPGQWIRLKDMNTEPQIRRGGGRWYPTLTTLPSYEVLAAGGHPTDDDPNHCNPLLETLSLAGGPPGSWTIVGSMPTGVGADTYPLYPRLHVLPDGWVLFVSPLPHKNDASHKWNPSTNTWLRVGQPWSSGTSPGEEYIELKAATGPLDLTYLTTSVLLPLMPTDNYRARVLLCGGSQPWVLDATASPTQWVATAPRALIDPATGQPPARYNLNAVLLLTGDVFVCGGLRANPNDPSGDENAVLEAELYQPGTDSWIQLDPAKIPRHYHSVALLMPDGRVWTSGTSKNRAYYEPGMDNRERSIELYEPWYYMQARPKITSAPDVIECGQEFTVASPQAASITRVALVRAGSVTHCFNSDQRYVVLSYKRSAQGLTITGPPNTSVAPPGEYLLVIVDERGVPSVGRFARVEDAPCFIGDMLLDTILALAASKRAPGRRQMQAQRQRIQRFRNDTLRRSPRGRELIAEFQRHGAELGKLISENPEVAKDVVELLARAEALIASLAQTQAKRLDASTIRLCGSVAQRLKVDASPSLQLTMSRLEEQLPLLRRATITQAVERLEQMNA